MAQIRFLADFWPAKMTFLGELLAQLTVRLATNRGVRCLRAPQAVPGRLLRP